VGSVRAQPAGLAGGEGGLGSQPTSASSAPCGLGPEPPRWSNAQAMAAGLAGGAPPRSAWASRPPAPQAWGAPTLRPSSSHPVSDRTLHSRLSAGITCSGLRPCPTRAGAELSLGCLEVRLELRLSRPRCRWVSCSSEMPGACLISTDGTRAAPRGASLSAAQVLVQDTSLLRSLSYSSACQSCK